MTWAKEPQAVRTGPQARDSGRPPAFRLGLHALAYLPWLALLAWLAATAWFLTDDAFISFRYARNLLDGYGLVFNPGERVEGYTNFLWVLELAAIWRVLGIPPEHAAPWLSVVCTAATLAAVLWWVAHLPHLRHRGLVGWMALGLVSSSATFAVWTSAGGLETRQFTFFIVLAVVSLGLYRHRRAGLLTGSLSLAFAALTRPEGLLTAACCFGWFALQRLADTGRPRPDRRALRAPLRSDWRAMLYLAAPFTVLVATHFLFRYAYYGEWLPNTWYAKVVRPWWDMGVAYYATAALETGLYLLVPLALVGLWARWRGARDGIHVLSLLCIGLHALYVMRVGGDHFEWRPLDFYWPLLAVAAAEGIVHLGAGAASAIRAASSPPPPRFRLPGNRACALALFLPVLFCAGAMQATLLLEADRIDDLGVALDRGNAGWPIRTPGMSSLDDLSSRMRRRITGHFVGTRWAVHREFAKHQIDRWRPYDGVARRLIPRDAVAAMRTLGIVPYYLSGLTVIDLNGLADKVIARNPVTVPNRRRKMAHDRCPPAGYLARRGVNFHPHPATASAAEAHLVAPYAVPAGPDLWLPFETDMSFAWVKESFAELSRVPGRADVVPAVFASAGAPVVGELFTVRLSDATRRAGFTDRALWRWERGSDAAGWRWAWFVGDCRAGDGTSYRYVPTADDVGLRLRAYTFYTDSAGNRVRATTPASAPVATR